VLAHGSERTTACRNPTLLQRAFTSYTSYNNTLPSPPPAVDAVSAEEAVLWVHEEDLEALHQRRRDDDVGAAPVERRLVVALTQQRGAVEELIPVGGGVRGEGVCACVRRCVAVRGVRVGLGEDEQAAWTGAAADDRWCHQPPHPPPTITTITAGLTRAVSLHTGGPGPAPHAPVT